MSRMSYMGFAVPVIFEDSDILLVDKPAGLLSSKIDSRQESLESIYPSFHPVHRLDKDTSGVLVIAKTPKVLERLQEQFRDREVKKEYLALVHGSIAEPGLIDIPIAQNPKIHDQFIADSQGRLAATRYEPVGNFQFSISNDLNNAQIKKLNAIRYFNYTLLKVFPLTGRTHQIRVHLKYIHHPIVSDEQYVGRKIYKLDSVWCPRQFLHAAKIGFYHPGSGGWVEFESKLPEDLEKALKKLDVTNF